MSTDPGPSPLVPRRRLRTELRRARAGVGLTQDQVAAAMDWSLSKLIRIENGTVSISTNDLRVLLNLYQIHDRPRVDHLVELPGRPVNPPGGASTGESSARNTCST